MANTIKLKNSGTAAAIPSTLEYGELGLNYADGKIFYKNSLGNIVEFTIATENLNAHESVHVATTAVLPNSPAYTAGSADGNNGYGIGAYLQASTYGTLSIDSHTLGVGDRVLVKNQVNQIHNGIYLVTTLGNGSTYWRLTRSLDSDNSTGPEVNVGDYVYVSQGTINPSTSWMMNSYGTNVDESIKIGTDNIIWVSVGVGPPGPPGPTGAGGTIAYFGGFLSNQNQPIATANTAQVVSFSSSYPTPFGISLVDGTKITMAHAGTYLFNFKAEVANLSEAVQGAQFWIKYNGTDWADSNTQCQLKARKNPGVPSEQLATMSLVGTAQNDGDYIELYWYGTSVDVSLVYTPATTVPVAPNTPSATITLTQVTYTQVGPTGATGSTGATGPTGSPGNRYYAELSNNISVLPVGSVVAGEWSFAPNEVTGQTTYPYLVGQRALVILNNSNYMVGNINWVDGYPASTFDFEVTQSVGTAGPSTGWTMDLWTEGATGATGATGAEGGTTTLTTKGDLLTRNGSALARLGVGTNGQVLKANSSATTGLEWGTASTVGILDDLTDVVIATPASGQVLEYNGSSWVNKNTVRDNYIRFWMEVQ